MSSETISIGIVFFSYQGAEVPIRIEGDPSENAVEALWLAVDEVLGRTHVPVDEWPSDPSGADDSGFAFSSVHDDDRDSLGSDYLHLPAFVSFRDMRLAVGPDDFRVRAQQSGFGGDGPIDGFMLWNLTDALNFGRDALEIYGAAEVVRRLGRAIRRRARRERRESADRWLHDGGEVPEALRLAVERHFQWTDDDLQTYFGLDRTEAQRLMAECNYSWSSEDLSYYSPGYPDAVN